MLSKSQLAIQLSKLKTFEKPLVREEQYVTDSEVAASWLFNAYLLNDVKDKVIADLGAGTGVLGIGALLLGAKKVYFVEKDKDAVAVLKENLQNVKGSYEILETDVKDFTHNADVVIMNPPFGTKQKHADKLFLERAFACADVIYSMHKSSTEVFVNAVALDNDFAVTHKWKYELPIKATYKFHKKRIERIDVSVFRLNKNLYK